MSNKKKSTKKTNKQKQASKSKKAKKQKYSFLIFFLSHFQMSILFLSIMKICN